MRLRIALLVLWPLGAVADLFIALAIVIGSPRQPRCAIARALLFVGSGLTNARWHAALALSEVRW